MRRAVSEGHWASAWAQTKHVLITHPNDADILTEVATVAAMTGRKPQAVDLMVEAAQRDDYDPLRVDQAIRALIEVGRLYDVISLLENAVDANPSDHSLRVKLIGFLKEAQLHHRIDPHYESLIRTRNFDLQLLLAFTDAQRRTYSAPMLELLTQRNPEDRRIQLGHAIDLMDNRKFDASEEVCRNILKRHADFTPVQALLGYVLAAQGRFSQIDEWSAGTSPHCRDDAYYWLALGSWAQSRTLPAQAARAFYEATLRDPNNPVAWTRLAGSIHRIRSRDDTQTPPLDQPQLESIEARIENLLAMRDHLTAFVWSGHTSQRNAIDIASTLSQLGRNWEAEAWAAVATTLKDDGVQNAAEVRADIIRKLKQDQQWQSTTWNPELGIDLSHLPAPNPDAPAGDEGDVVAPVVAGPLNGPSNIPLRLSEESAQWGLVDVGGGSDPEDDRRGALTRSTGAGGGALDFDLDGRCDVAVLGAGGTMLRSDSNPNLLMRNLGNELKLVSGDARFADTDFGQGCCVGDYNEDGFPDVFLANLGRNRLLRNNGDGSFSDCSHLLGDRSSPRWTTCAAFIDLNRDGIADLVTGNYCTTDGAPDRPCPNESGELGTCHPLRFRAQANELYLAGPDGQFHDRTQRLIGNVTPGRTMGILAGSLLPDEIGVLLANDMSPNEFLTPTDSDTAKLEQSAVARGVAVDAGTRPQASMGIAASDFDGDGDLDFYVTGFANEHNIYYEQTAPGCWSDVTTTVGLLKPTLSLVGFGTEAIDLDDDGTVEIAVTNGHIGEFDDGDYAYEQPFQLFRRQADGRFAVVDDDDWGDYFERAHVGRALWTIDINADDRNDLLVTHTREQARLLVNRTADQNHRISFRLVGTTCSRDATGAVLRFSHAGRNRSLWCLSGDGYLCSNERILRAGLGPSDKVTEVKVFWPDGSTDSIGTLDADARYLIVQGQGSATKMNLGHQ
ncbi:ASPIC and UnbV [Stieleria maiorica]|uniref:ASPIC and UnbV n=2 Tax=Stieleria maiorica TaxID=2795974 RepID=A0A5B9MIK4_9BACT|nr:ASPIC and UnbV [Stieleria maiorica]